MRDRAHNDAPARKVRVSNSSGSFAVVGRYWKAYWKLALGILLVVLQVVFVVQNANAIRVKFLMWEVDMSQALVVFLSALSGLAFGLIFNKWQRWRSSRV